MRYLNYRQDPRWRPTLVFLVLSIIVWFGGPYVAVAGNAYFANIQYRLIAILALALLWGLNNLRLTARIQNAVNQTLPIEQDSPFFHELTQITQNIKRSWDLIKRPTYQRWHWHKNPVKQQSNYIILGQSKSGKSALLAAMHADEETHPLMNNTYYDCWQTNQALFFDFHLDSNKSLSVLWEHVLSFFKQHLKQHPLNGVIVTISLSQLYEMPREQQLQNLTQITEKLSVIKQHFPQVPVYITFTQTDLIAGFNEFFANLDANERSQIFGINLPITRDLSELTAAFSTEYNQLLGRLNDQLIWRLHQEHSLQRRARIKDFLLQLDILKTSVMDLLKQLSDHARITLNGCYFTSSVQGGNPVDYLVTPLQHAYNIELPTLTEQGNSHKTYFVADFFQHIVSNTDYHYTKSPKWRYGLYLLLAMATLSMVTWWYQSYSNNLIAINHLKTALAEAEQLANNNPHQAYAELPVLNALATALPSSQNAWSIWITTAGLAQAQEVIADSQKTYQKILVSQFLPQLEETLELQLQQTSNENPSGLYSTLKAYIMLTEAKHRDPAYITQWFDNYWLKIFPHDPTTQTQLHKHLSNLLQNNTFVLTPDENVIAAARTRLAQTPLPQLTFAVLVDRYRQSTIDLLPSTNKSMVIKDNYTIPSLYTAANFPKVYADEIVNATQELMEGNWVIGNKLVNLSANKTARAELIDQVQTLYVTAYVNAWQTLLNKLSWQSNSADMEQLKPLLADLTTQRAALWQVLNLIYINTAPNPAEPEFTAGISSKFQALDTFLSNQVAYSQLQAAVTSLANYMQHIANARHPEKAAYAAAAIRMANEERNDDALASLFQQIPNLPLPLQQWMSTFANNNWQALLNGSQEYLNGLWTTKVLTKYNDNLANHFPLDKAADTDVKISAFSDFFGPNGVIDDFFNTYLKPFVDTRQFYWVWKNVDGMHLNVPQTTLDMFMRATLIQKMFFPDNSKKLSVKFSLVPIAIEPGIARFTLEAAGETIIYQPNKPQTINLEWPGQNANFASIEFINTNGKQAHVNYHGEWAWFRLLANANLQTSNNPKQFRLTFDLNGNSVQYQLQANELVNPFIPSIIEAFRCPDKL